MTAVLAAKHGDGQFCSQRAVCTISTIRSHFVAAGPSGLRPGCSLRRPSPWQLPSIQHSQIMKTIDIEGMSSMLRLDTAVGQVHSDKVVYWRVSETLRGKTQKNKQKKKQPKTSQVGILIERCQKKSRKRNGRRVGLLFFQHGQRGVALLPPHFVYLYNSSNLFNFIVLNTLHPVSSADRLHFALGLSLHASRRGIVITASMLKQGGQ